IIWKKNYGGIGDENIYDLVELNDKSIVFCASSDTANNDVSNNIGGYDAWVVRVDSVGNKIWDRSFGGSNYDFLTSILKTKNGTLLLTGYTYSSDSDAVTNFSNASDYFLVSLDINGTKLSSKCLGGNKDDFAFCSTETSDGNLIILGNSLSSNSGDCLFANYDTTQMSSHDIWLLGLGTKPFVDVVQNVQQDAPKNNYIIYPNPINSSNDLFNIQSTSDLYESVITIKNVIGETMYEKHINTSTNKLQIESTNLISGIYFIEILSNKQTQTLKFIKQ
ncbi:MAG: hypothetical protein RIQ33_383, partial [Bacteroidota bacterium]